MCVCSTYVFFQEEDKEDDKPEDDPSAEYKPDKAHHPEEVPQAAENYGKSQETTDDKEKQEVIQDAGKSEEEKAKEVRWVDVRA